MRNLNTFLSFGIVYLLFSSFALGGSITKPNSVNLNHDQTTNFFDFAILANNWQQLGAGLAGDFDDSNFVDIDDLFIFSWYWLTEYSEYQQCQGIGTDLDENGIIAFGDLAKFAQNWLLTGSGLVGDFDKSQWVDCNDLSILADCWLKGTRPLDVWGQFKAALSAGDVNEALTFVAEASKDRYAEIFQIIEPNLPDYVAGMGDLILESQENRQAKYEMKHQIGENTYLFPVIFI